MLRIAPSRSPRRRAVLGVCAVGAVVAGTFTGTQAAFASTDTTWAAVTADFAAGVDNVTLGNDFPNQTTDTLTLAPNSGQAGFTTLDLAGHSLSVQAIELTSNVSGTMTGSSLTIVGAGTLTVTQTSTSYPAIEVSAGSTLTVQNGTVVASVPAASSAAAIGGGPSIAGPENSGSIVIQGLAQVSATRGAGGTGAAVGAGYGGTANVSVRDSAVLTASASGSGAAIGDGYGAAGGTVAVHHHAQVTAHQTGTGQTGAGIGGGASPTSQTAGAVTVGDDAVVTATSAGKGAAIGGGYHGDGGSVTVSGYATVTATADPTTGEAGIGDGEGAVSTGSTVAIQNAATVTAAGGGAGGAGIGGGSGAYGRGSVTVSDASTVDASSTNGPGIGGQRNRNSFGVNISGTATVTATGGGHGAGIGGGDSFSSSFPSVGATVSIGAGADVTVAAANGVSAIGAGTGVDFGSLANSGTLVVPATSSVTVPAAASATSDGALVVHGAVVVAGTLSSSGDLANDGAVTVSGTLTNSGTLVNTGSIGGSGTVANTGRILQNGTFTPSSVTGNAFRLVYDGQGGTKSAASQLVYADTVANAQQTLATATPPTTGTFSGWSTTADGTGTTVGAATSISSVAGGTATGAPLAVQLYALYQIAPVLPTSTTLGQGVVGSAYSATVAASSGTAPITYTRTSGDLPAGLSLDAATGAITGTPTTAGTFTMTVLAANTFVTSHDYTITIVPTRIVVTVPTTPTASTRYLAGATASVHVTGLQANETYSITIGGTVAATGRAASSAGFTRKVTVPRSIGDGLQSVKVSGGEHVTAGTASILTAAVSKSLGLKLSAKSVKAKHALTVTVSRLYASESVRVLFQVRSGSHWKTLKSAVGTATSKGLYVLKLKSGLVKGRYTVVVTGAGTSRTAKTTLKVV